MDRKRVIVVFFPFFSLHKKFLFDFTLILLAAVSHGNRSDMIISGGFMGHVRCFMYTVH